MRINKVARRAIHMYTVKHPTLYLRDITINSVVHGVF